MPLYRSHKWLLIYADRMISRLRPLIATPYDSPETKFCILGLQVLCRHAEEIWETSIESKIFLSELLEVLEKCANPDNVPVYEMKDYAFNAVECIAPVLQEFRLRKPTLQICEAQAAFHHHFEECGEWRKDDGKMVTEYYYFSIPAAVSAA